MNAIALPGGNGHVNEISRRVAERAATAGRYMMLRAADITVDPTYQRSLSPSIIKKMGAYDASLVGVIQVSRRTNGKLVAFDGQHRLILARSSGVEMLPCLVHDGMTVEEESRQFAGLNAGRGAPQFIDIFNARLTGGDEVASAVAAIIEEQGFKPARHHAGQYTKWPWVASLKATENVFTTGGAELLATTLGVIREAYSGDDKATSAPIVTGIAAVVYFYGTHPDFDVKKLIQRLGTVPPSRLIRRGMEIATSVNYSGSGSQLGRPGFRLSVVEAYNKGARNKLPELTASHMQRKHLGQNPWAPES